MKNKIGILTIVSNTIISFRKIIFVLLTLQLFSVVIGSSTSTQFVSNIKFQGNETFSSIELIEIIRLQNPGLLSKSNFTNKILKLDTITLEAFYRSNGFINVVVNGTIEAIDNDLVSVLFQINEGERYIQSSIEIVGNKLFSDSEILKILLIETNTYYNPSNIRKKLKLLKYKFKTFGKKDIVLVDETEVVKDKVKLRITISEGPTYSIKSVKIRGNEIVKQKYITREILFTQGEIFSIEKIDETKNNIFATGLFNFVEILYVNDIDQPNSIHITIQLREFKTRGIYAELGFDQIPSTVDGNESVSIINSSLDWQLGNVFKTATKLGVGLELGFKANEIEKFNLFRKYYQININSPWFWKFRIPITNKLYFEDLNDDSRIFSYGYNSSLVYKNTLNTQLLITMNFDFIDATNEDLDLVEDHSISLTFNKQNIDNPIEPQNGYYFSFSPSIHGSYLGGNRHYFQTDIEIKGYRKILDPIILAMRFKTNYIRLFENYNDFLTTYELFHLGGESTLRGWSSIEDFYDDSQNNLNENGSPIRQLCNVEFRFPIYWKFGGTVFYDGGFLANKINEDFKWFWDWGYGINFKTPLGPARFEFAFPFADKNKRNFTLSMAYMF